MLLYLGIFTVGFYAGSILAFVLFAPKNPEQEENDYAPSDLLGEIKENKEISGISFPPAILNKSDKRMA